VWFIFIVVAVVWRRLRARRDSGIAADEQVMTADESGNDPLSVAHSPDDAYDVVDEPGQQSLARRGN
jgi:hypothetical protein